MQHQDCTVLDCVCAHAEVLLLSWLLLGARYRPAHVAGALLAILGSSILVLSDSKGGVGDGPRPLLGDGLVLIGATMYAVLNIAEERLLGEILSSAGVTGAQGGARVHGDECVAQKVVSSSDQGGLGTDPDPSWGMVWSSSKPPCMHCSTLLRNGFLVRS